MKVQTVIVNSLTKNKETWRWKIMLWFGTGTKHVAV